MVSVGRRTIPPDRSSAAISSSCASVGAPATCHRFTFRPTQQLARVHDRGRRDLFSPQHSRDLLDPFLALVETTNASARVTAGIFFPNEKVRRCEARDLWEMRHADDLIDGRKLLQLAADDLRHPPSDAGIDLIEHQGGLGRLL